MGTPEKKYELDDGSLVSAADVAKKVGLSQQTARSRLKRYTNPADIFRPARTYSTQHSALSMMCSDGVARTPRQVEKEFGTPTQLVSTRMRRLRVKGVEVADLKHLIRETQRKPRDDHEADVPKPSMKILKDRMFFDPDGHWKLLNKCL